MMRTIFLLSILIVSAVASAGTELGIKGNQFTINGKPTFLLGISFYGALGASKDFIRRDLDDMQKYGFNWFRLWATWGAFENEVSAVNPQGKPRGPYLSKLKWLVAECDRRGIIVDVTLSRGNGTETDNALSVKRRPVSPGLPRVRAQSSKGPSQLARAL